ncbi:hypothetical protein VTK56DRAFT_2790 [Thermocarpiscus australiensis]
MGKKKTPAAIPVFGTEDHNQPVKDPLAHFRAIPWAAALLSDPAVLAIAVADRRPRAGEEMSFIQRVLNSDTTVRACVTFWMRVPRPQPQLLLPEQLAEQAGRKGGPGPMSSSRALLQGGGRKDGEDPERPFLLLNALLDLGEDLCGWKGMLHGGALAAMMDEVLCAAADNQSSESFWFLPLFSSFLFLAWFYPLLWYCNVHKAKADEV